MAIKTLKVRAAKHVYSWLHDSHQARFNVLYGGASSAKSWSMALYLLTEKFWKLPGVGLLVCRKTKPAVRTSCWRLVEHWLSEMGLWSSCKVNHTNLTITAPNGSFIQFAGLDDVEKLKCFSANTEVLTDQGFKLVSEVNKGDLLASMDPDTREASFRPVTNTWAYDYDGPMIQPQSETGRRRPWVDFCVTPGHKMLVRTYHRKRLRFIEAQDLPGSYWVPRGSTWGGRLCETYAVPDSGSAHTTQTRTFPIVPFLKFLGWHISDGSFGCNKRYQLAISQIKKEGRAQIREDLKDFPYPVWEGKTAFTLAGKDLYEWLHQYGHYSHERRIPPDILELHPSLLRHLFDAMMAGDGTVTKTGRCVYCTNSRGLADDMTIVALKLGYVPTTKEWYPKYAGNYANGRPYWSLSMVKHVDTCVRGTETINYQGKVYGFSVPPHHTVLIRHQGKLMWCGQSVEGINYVWAEEATEIHERDLWQLHIRCRANNPYENNAVYLTFNPVDPIRNDWLKAMTQMAPDGTYLKRPLRVRMVTYLDNPFLSEEERATIEGLADSDDEYDKIYRQGKWATPSGVIYDNWDIVEEIPHVDDYGYGLDFGYTNPTALIWCGIRDETDLYLREVLYETHLHNQELIERLAQLGVGRDDVIVADSSEPAYIDEIADAGYNIHPCVKTGGQGDKSFVRTGINRVKRMRMHVHSESTNVTDELGSYKWRHTKNNDPLDEPVKFRDHAVDAIRYYVGSRPEPSETVVVQIPEWLRAQLAGG